MIPAEWNCPMRGIQQNKQKRISGTAEIRFFKYVRFVYIKTWISHGDKQSAGI